jgi:hypothetical protein
MNDDSMGENHSYHDASRKQPRLGAFIEKHVQTN